MYSISNVDIHTCCVCFKMWSRMILTLCIGCLLTWSFDCLFVLFCFLAFKVISCSTYFSIHRCGEYCNGEKSGLAELESDTLKGHEIAEVLIILIATFQL